MHNRMMRVLVAQFMAAVFVVLSATAQAGLQEANEALAAKDYAAALKELEPLATKGDAYAQYNLAKMYDDGTGVPLDIKVAESWYRKAAVQGYADAQAMLGILYDNGAGVPQDYKQAVSWYRKAAEQGHPMAQSLLGASYAEGHGVAINLVQALKWFIVSASTGYNIGQQNVKAAEAVMSKKQIEQARTLAQQWQKAKKRK